MTNTDLDKLIETLNKIRDNAIADGDSCDYIDYIDETIAFVRSKQHPVMQEGKIMVGSKVFFGTGLGEVINIDTVDIVGNIYFIYDIWVNNILQKRRIKISW